MIASLEGMEPALRMIRASWLKRTTCDVHSTCLHCSMMDYVFIYAARGCFDGKRVVKCERRLQLGGSQEIEIKWKIVGEMRREVSLRRAQKNYKNLSSRLPTLLRIPKSGELRVQAEQGELHIAAITAKLRLCLGVLGIHHHLQLPYLP